jgi:multidrug efflux pump subunit AcrB
VVDVYLPQGTDIAVTADELARVEDYVRAKAGVTHVTSFIGQGGLRFMLTYSPEDPNSSYGQLLVDVDEPARIAELVSELQQELPGRHPSAEIKAWKFMLGRGGGQEDRSGVPRARCGGSAATGRGGQNGDGRRARCRGDPG